MGAERHDKVKTGEPKSITYDDGQTPSVTYSYNRLGAPSGIQDGLGRRQFTYDDELQLALEDITTGRYAKARGKRDRFVIDGSGKRSE